MPDQEVTIRINAEDRATGAFSKLGASIITLNQGFNLAVSAARILKAGLEAVIGPAMEQERVMRQVQTNVQNAGGAWADIKPKLDAYAQSVIRLGFEDEATAESVSRLMLVTKNYDQALKLNQLALDLAVAKNISLADATTKVAQITSGAGARALVEYNIHLKDSATTAETLDALNKAVGGSAKNAAETAETKWKVAKIQFKETAEAIGTMLLPALTKILGKVADIAGQGVNDVHKFRDGINDVSTSLLMGGNILVALDRKIGETFGVKNRGLIASFVGSMGDALKMVGKFGDQMVQSGKVITDFWIDKAGTGIKSLADNLGVDLVGSANSAGMTVGQMAAGMKTNVESVGTTVKSTKNEFAGIGGATDQAAQAASNAADDIVAAYEKVRDEIRKVNDDIISIQEKTDQLTVDHAKDTTEWKAKLATAFVSQEQKVADLRMQIASEVDFDQRAKLQEQLKREEAALNAKRTIEIAFQNEVAEARRISQETEFERQLENIAQQKAANDEEFQMKLEQYTRELEAKEKQRDALIKLEDEISKQAIAASKARTQSMVDHVQQLINKYNELANAASRAYSITAPTAGPMSFAPAVKKAVGGTIPGPYLGAPVPALMHAGEEVIPIGAAQGRGGSGVNVTINYPFFLDKSSMQKIMGQMMSMLREQVRV